jgi:putative ABC transport system substrate-binding protein
LIEGLRKFGYVEGKNLAIEEISSGGNPDRLPSLIAQLVQKKVDVIVVGNTTAALAAKKLTTTIQIVFANAADPVGAGVVASLARPGGNVTGVSSVGIELAARRLQLLKDTFPKISRTAVFVTKVYVSAEQLVEVERAAKALGLMVFPVELRRGDHIDQTVALLRKSRADSMLVTDAAWHLVNRELLASVAAKMRVPAIYGTRQYAESGGLMAYGADLAAQFRSAARLIDRILKGTKPADLPVEQATEFEFLINMKTAKALGLTIPQSILARADKVIE